jgi:hypothetical protein
MLTPARRAEGRWFTVCAVAMFGVAAFAAPPFRAALIPQSVVLHVSVVDAGGQAVRDLTAADFEVLVDGAPTTVTSVAPRGTLSLAVVADTSRSTAWGPSGPLPPPREQVRAVLAELAESDRVRFGSFGPEVRFPERWQARGTRNLASELNKALSVDERETHGPSPVWDVLYDTITMLAAEPPPRAILLLTDGRSTGNARSLDMVAEHAALHGVALHSIVRYVEVQIPHGDQVLVIVRPWVAFERLAFYTGGTAVAYAMPQHLEGLDRAGKLGGAIRDTYAIAIAPGDHDQPRRLSIRAKRSGLNVLAPRVLFPANTR